MGNLIEFRRVAKRINIIPEYCMPLSDWCSNTIDNTIAVNGSNTVNTEALVAGSLCRADIYKKNGITVPTRLSPITHNQVIAGMLSALA